MRVLHVEYRVILALLNRLGEVKIERRVVLAHQHHEPDSVRANLIHHFTKRHELAGTFRHFDRLAGEFVTLREVVDEVGADAVRFMMLMRKNDAPLDFDLAKVIERSQDNPVFYVQYAHARARSVLRQGKAVFGDFDLNPLALSAADLSLLTDEGERELMRTAAQYPRLALQAAEAHEPHRVAFFAHELATRFHAHWNRGKDNHVLRFINENDRKLTYSRLSLVAGVGLVLASALSILGVSAPEEMR